MSKMSSDRVPGPGALVERFASGPTMGASFHVRYFAPARFDPGPLERALQAIVDRIDARMSTWKSDSDLNRLNAAPVGTWVTLPADLMRVLDTALLICLESGGVFDIAVGDAVRAWGFGPPNRTPDAARIRELSTSRHSRAPESLELDRLRGRARRLRDAAFDLSGIAKGFAVDELARALEASGLSSYLAGIDGELRIGDAKPDGSAWSVAVERPTDGDAAPAGILSLLNCAVATSGNYRNRKIVNGHPISHVIDPAGLRPAAGRVASVTVIAEACMAADAWATALLVAGPDDGLPRVKALGHDALFLIPDGENWIALGTDAFSATA